VRRKETGQGRQSKDGDVPTPRASAGARRPPSRAGLREVVASLDAEDIALERLQAHLRRAEAIQISAGPGASTLRRTTVRLPPSLLARLRDRARRDGTTASEVVEQALERFLGSR
jgi:Arc/MetJ-type ribon-helix-helix transcriptional regulator